MGDATPREDENSPAASRRERERRHRDANREKRRQRQRAWRKANPEKVKAQQARDRPAIEKYNAEHREKILEQKRIAEHHRRERLKKENAARARTAERVQRYDAAHPEQVRERERRYRQAHREQIRQRQREYYASNKEQIKARNTERAHTDPRYQEFQRRYRDANREKIKERQREHRADPEVYDRALECNRQWRQRERYRLKAGLPRVRPHAVRKREKENNSEAAEAFFSRERGEDERFQVASELDQLRSEKERAQKVAQRRGAERAAIARICAARIDEYLVRHGRRLVEEVRLDSRARELRGADPYPDLEAETRRRATAALAEPLGQPAFQRATSLQRPGVESTGLAIGVPSPTNPYLGM